MKRKLFSIAFLLLVGGYTPNLYQRAVEWYNTPPAPPSAAVQDLIASLDRAEGWSISKCKYGESPVLLRGGVYIRPSMWHASVRINDALCNDQFSNHELSLLNDAAERCLKKLSVQYLVQAPAAK